MSNLLSKITQLLKRGKQAGLMDAVERLYSLYVKAKIHEDIKDIQGKLVWVENTIVSFENSLDFLDKNVRLLWDAQKIQQLLHSPDEGFAFEEKKSLFTQGGLKVLPPPGLVSPIKPVAPPPQRPSNLFLLWGKTVCKSLGGSFAGDLIQSNLIHEKWELPDSDWDPLPQRKKNMAPSVLPPPPRPANQGLLPSFFSHHPVRKSVEEVPHSPCVSKEKKPPAILKQQQKLDHYILLEKMGCGPHGEVWKAFDRKTNLPYRIKIFHAPQAMAPYLRFTPLANHFIHRPENWPPGLLPIVSAQKGDPSYVVWPWFEGPTLGSALIDGPLSVRQALEVGEQIAQALLALHEKNICHFNLRPSNVLIGPEKIQLIDYGIPSQDILWSSEEDLFSKPGYPQLLAYFSPEQKSKKLALDFKSDLYQWGLLLFEMLTGKIPQGPQTQPYIFSPTPAGFMASLDEFFHFVLAPHPRRCPSISAVLPLVRRLKSSFVTGFEFGAVPIPGGRIFLGDDLGELPSQRPRVLAKVEHFVLESHPIWVDQYLEFVFAGGYEKDFLWDKDGWLWLKEEPFDLENFMNHNPEKEGFVRWVSWYEARAYATWTGKRLPSSAEWETAARFYKRKGHAEEWNLLFTGLVWCADPFDPLHYQKCQEACINPGLPPSQGRLKVVRGRPHLGYPRRMSLRFGMKPGKRDRSTGIQLAVDLHFKKESISQYVAKF